MSDEHRCSCCEELNKRVAWLEDAVEVLVTEQAAKIAVTARDAADAFADAILEQGAVITMRGWAIPGEQVPGVPWSFMGWCCHRPDGSDGLEPGGFDKAARRAMVIATERARKAAIENWKRSRASAFGREGT